LGILDCPESFGASVIQIEIDVPDCVNVALRSGVRSAFERVHPDVDVESRLIPLLEPLLKIRGGDLFRRCDPLDDFLGTPIPKQKRDSVRELEIVEDILGRRKRIRHWMTKGCYTKVKDWTPAAIGALPCGKPRANVMRR
jgi:hypothetical protein